MAEEGNLQLRFLYRSPQSARTIARETSEAKRTKNVCFPPDGPVPFCWPACTTTHLLPSPALGTVTPCAASSSDDRNASVDHDADRSASTTLEGSEMGKSVNP